MLKKRFSLILTILFLITGLSLCYASNLEKKLFPPKLGTFKLVKLIKGKKAMEEVYKLHGKKINIKAAWVAHYENIKNPKDKVTVWISQASSEKEAKKQVEVMMKKIINSSSTPFYHFNKMKDVYIFFGLGKRHLVFPKKEFVFWITGEPGELRYFVHYYYKVLK